MRHQGQARPDTTTLGGRIRYAAGKFRSWPGYWLLVLTFAAAWTSEEAGILSGGRSSLIVFRLLGLAGIVAVAWRTRHIRSGQVREFHQRTAPAALGWRFFIAALAGLIALNLVLFALRGP